MVCSLTPQFYFYLRSLDLLSCPFYTQCPNPSLCSGGVQVAKTIVQWRFQRDFSAQSSPCPSSPSFLSSLCCHPSFFFHIPRLSHTYSLKESKVIPQDVLLLWTEGEGCEQRRNCALCTNVGEKEEMMRDYK